MKTVSRGIRLPADLWAYVKGLNPEATYSDIVHTALLQVYDPDEETDIAPDEYCFKIRKPPSATTADINAVSQGVVYS